MTKKILIIAGSDPSGGAGIQADIKTVAAHKAYSCSVISCLTAQNTQKVSAVENPPIAFLQKQIETVLSDVKFDAVKIGMLGNAKIIKCVSKILPKNIPLILDPVMVATSGDLLLEKNGIEALKDLISQAKIVTPNIDEAEILADVKIKNLADMMLAAAKIKDFGCEAVLVKGGHLKFTDGRIYSILLDENNQFHKVSNKRIGKKNIHGTGCTLASALACNIAKNGDLLQATRSANRYVSGAILRSLKVGKGSLVLGH